MAKKLRVGVVSYLNAMPLWFSLQHDDSIELVPDTPSNLSRRMQDGELDIGLIPVVEALRDERLTFLPDLGIAADGIVDSVGLFTNEDLPRVKSCVLSGASRTSNTLARIVLAESGATPIYSEESVAPEALIHRREDAVLMIGDACLRARNEQHDRVWVDLATEWKILANLPFVFAVWAGPRDVLTPGLHARLTAALHEGRELAFDLVRHAAMDIGWTEADLGQYLSEVIIHQLTPDCLKGLLEFAHRASAAGLVPRESVDKVLDVMRG